MTTSVKNNEGKAWKPENVWTITERMQLVERTRASDRAIINNQFNGGRPYTDKEAEEYQIDFNINFNEGKQILIPAINQLNNALIFKERFFTVSSKGGKPEKKQEYADIFTRNIHVPLKHGESGKKQMFLLKNRNAALALHGIGPVMWMNDFSWRGKFIPLEDLLIPTDTWCDFSNLMFFAVNRYLTAGEFFDMTHGESVDKGWNQKMVKAIMDDMVKPSQAQASQYFALQDQPEKQIEWLKQNRCAWDYDAANTVKIRLFFYKDHKSKKWHRCVILREGTPNVPADKQEEFLYDGTSKPYAKNLARMLHVQFGDNSIVAPLKYHSVRGLGVDLYGPVECNNRTRCEFQQHVSFQMKTLLRISNPVDRDRPKVLDLSQYSVVEDGVNFIPKEERYQIDPRLADQALSQSKQMMGEASSSYVRDIESTSGEPRTATETNVLATQATESVSNMLQGVYAQEEFYWEEEVRRFCLPNSEDEEVKAFQEKCIADGIPKELMKSDNWIIKIERALGGGDQYMASQEASALLGQSQRYDPQSQRIILRKWTNTITRDPKMGELLVPDDPNMATKGKISAEDVFGTLMQGIPASIRQGIERTEYVEAMLGMMNSKIQQITQIDGMGTPQEFIGLNTVGQHIAQNIEILAQDQTQKQNVKIYADHLGKLMNLVKAFGQRQQQAAEEKAARENFDPEMQAKIQLQQQMGQQKMELNAASAQQKMQTKQMQTQQQMAIKQQQFEQQMAQQMEKHRLEMMTLMEQTQAELTAQGIVTGSTVASERQKTQAKIENDAKLAEVSAKNKPTTNGRN